MRQQYSLFKRSNGVYYFWEYSPEGVRKKRSTGEKTKQKAKIFVENFFARRGDKNDSPFRVIFQGWFEPSTCPHYLESKRDGRILSAEYMRCGKVALNKYIMPYFGNRFLPEIRPMIIDDWKYLLLEEKGLSGKTVGTYMSYLSIMLDWAWRREYIDENPCKRVKLPKKNSRERGILTKEEAKKLFDHPWKNDLARVANYLAMITGMRAGEVIALRKSDINIGEDSYLRIQHSYNQRDHVLGETKTRKTRYVPIPKSFGLLLKFLNTSESGFVFSRDGVAPIGTQACRENLRRELERIGIGLAEQKERNICFHSWRHFLNSQLRVSGVPDLITREITGHATEAMMEHYTHLSPEDMRAVGKVQLELVSNH